MARKRAAVAAGRSRDRLHARLGAHPVRRGGKRGVGFAVWAPNALRASVVGEFNGWDASQHPMRRRGASGVWEIFVPDLRAGERYAYHLGTASGDRVKVDPVGFAMEVRPRPVSIVWDLERYRWGDAKWIASRAARQAAAAPLSIYEVDLGSWRRAGARSPTYGDLARRLVPYAKRMGFTHLGLLPIQEHATDASRGGPLGLFAPTSRFGSPDDFKRFVDSAHRAGIGVLLDWLPARFPRDDRGLAAFDGAPLYEHAGLETVGDCPGFDLGRPEVAEFLHSNALFWLEEHHVDGLRVLGLASMLQRDETSTPSEGPPAGPSEAESGAAVAFLTRLNRLVHRHVPGALVVAAESSGRPGVTHPVEQGGLGFDLAWNRGWTNDTLAYVGEDPPSRRYFQRRLTFSMVYAFSERFVLPLAHDEVVGGKKSLLGRMPGGEEQKRANLRLLYAYMFAHPGKKLLFMGGELGQLGEWNPEGQLDWDLLEKPEHAGLQRFVRDLNRLHASESALHASDFSARGFEWIDFRDDSRSVLAFLRRGPDPEDFVVVVANGSPVQHDGYRIGIPAPGRYRQILNTDAVRYGGGGRGTAATIEASPEPAMRRPYSLVLTLPPLAVLVFKLDRARGRSRVRAGDARRSRARGRSPAGRARRVAHARLRRRNS